MRAFLDTLYQSTIAGNQKAIVAFILAALLGFLAQHGLRLSLDMTTALTTLLSGVVTAAGVYLTENK